VDAAAADLRRIERDLHDGAQARLVALAMDLGVAREKLTEDPQEAARMVDSAHGEVKTALRELRDLARGIHPAVLTDRGLDAALSAVAARCGQSSPAASSAPTSEKGSRTSSSPSCRAAAVPWSWATRTVLSLIGVLLGNQAGSRGREG
ncbi:sensor histidine kinase, partial [Streptomyces neyagawaensis]|uniref:sensor histidine kinase n=1 Tax=Streptomyces neyagawaensis TaxID=42238 RepID=UPI001F0B0852